MTERQRVEVLWAGYSTMTPSVFEAPYIRDQMWTCGRPGPHGGRPATIRLYDAPGGKETSVIKFADAYQIIKSCVSTSSPETDNDRHHQRDGRREPDDMEQPQSG